MQIYKFDNLLDTNKAIIEMEDDGLYIKTVRIIPGTKGAEFYVITAPKIGTWTPNRR